MKYSPYFYKSLDTSLVKSSKSCNKNFFGNFLTHIDIVITIEHNIRLNDWDQSCMLTVLLQNRVYRHKWSLNPNKIKFETYSNV